jgi:pantothenate kinase
VKLPPAYLARAQALAQGPRRLLGLVGPPGSGKSTVALALADALGAAAVVVPMDGFHLAQTELERLQRAHRKGAPDTFDSAGYAALLRRLRLPVTGEVVYAPTFNRTLEEPIAGAVPVPHDVPLVITEGNYLLLPDGHWAEVAPLLDEVWYVEVPDGLRQQRLIERHQHHGRSVEAARAWVETTDEPNARLIAAHKARATCVFQW